MLLHTLEVTAFGPFAGTERVDFDPLGDTGLFLLTGSTGAGKTSLLDAACFALFGSVPGARDQAARLRSDHARDGVPPRVSLELTVGGRRLRVIRTPTWYAPRRRGTGDPIKQQPTVVLSHRRDGQWEPLSSRIPEVADQMQSMLGMDVHQFTQVAMLPQGAFAQFLRSGADERKKVLERLFGTQRFRSVERWLVDHRRDCKTRSETALQELRRNVDRARGAAGDIAPGMQQGDDPAHWPHEVVLLRDRLGALHARALAEQRRLESTAAATSNQLEQARTLRRLQERLAAARRRLADLEATSQQAETDAQRLEAAERAAAVAAHLERLDAAEDRTRSRLRDFQAAVGRSGRLGLEVPDQDDDDRAVQVAFMEHVCRTSQKLVDGAEELRELVSEHRRAAKVLAGLRTERANAASALSGARERVDAAPERRRLLEEQIAHARSAMALQPHWSAEVDRVSAVHRAAVALPDAVAARDVATAERDATYAALNKAEAQLNEVVRMRLESAASWLATMLRDGEPCEVCGSVEHPAPHPRALDAPGEHDERRARTVAQRAQRAKEAADERLTVAREQVARLESTSGGMLLADVEADRAAVTSRLTGAREAAVRLTDLDAVLADLDAQLARDRAGLETSARLADVLAERLATLQAQDDDRVAQLVEAVGEGLDIDGHVVRVHRCDEAAQALLAALRDLAAAEAEQENASAAAHRALAAAGFATLAQVRVSLLEPAAVAALRTAAQSRHDNQRRAQEELADPEVALAAQLPAPHLGALEAQQTAARAKAAAAAECSSVLGARLVDVTRWSDEVEASCAAWRPLCERTAVAEAMASLAEGQSADNVLHVSLSAYVLAARLQQVVAAANEHLLPMSSGRYTLEHTMDRSAGDRRGAGGGLGLLVCDQWTGESRDPKTLSGGETFQASLSLALGLSDVVTSEVGGVELRTLFVDEGFGSLDADSLDEVMDVLDGLRAGGRRVGVVSHVDAMRERIPSQIRLIKTPTGSRVEQLTA